MSAAHLPDLLSLTQLRQVANATPQPYRIHAQVDTVTQKQTAAGKPYFDVKLTDGSEPIVWRLFDGNPLMAEAAQLERGAWVEITALWVDKGKYGLDPTNATMRRLTTDETEQLMAGDEELRTRQLQDYGEIVTRIATIG